MRLSSSFSAMFFSAFLLTQSGIGSQLPDTYAQGKPDFKSAKQHYQLAEDAVASKDWEKAVREYQAAYMITGDPILFFKIGKAYHLSNNCKKAMEHYHRYLRQGSPSHEYTQETLEKVQECQAELKRECQQSKHECQQSFTSIPSQALENQMQPKDSPTQNTKHPLANEPETEFTQANIDDEINLSTTDSGEEKSWQNTAAWSSVGISLAFLSAGAVLGLSANSKNNDLDRILKETTPSSEKSRQYTNLQKEKNDLSTMAIVAISLSGASAAAAVVFFVLDEKRESKNSTGLQAIHPKIDSNSVGISANWAF